MQYLKLLFSTTVYFKRLWLDILIDYILVVYESHSATYTWAEIFPDVKK